MRSWVILQASVSAAPSADHDVIRCIDRPAGACGERAWRLDAGPNGAVSGQPPDPRGYGHVDVGRHLRVDRRRFAADVDLDRAPTTIAGAWPLAGPARPFPTRESMSAKSGRVPDSHPLDSGGQ